MELIYIIKLVIIFDALLKYRVANFENISLYIKDKDTFYIHTIKKILKFNYKNKIMHIHYLSEENSVLNHFFRTNTKC
jgi:hypothetical protein